MRERERGRDEEVTERKVDCVGRFTNITLFAR